MGDGESGYGVVDSPTLKDGGGTGDVFAATGALRQLPKEDFELAKKLWGLYKRAKKWKQQCGASDWDRYWQLWRANQWLKPRPIGMSQVVVDIVYEIIETFLGHIVDDLPSPAVHSRKPDQQKIAQMVKKLLDWTDDINDIERNIELPIRSAAVTGFGVRRVSWNPEMDGWRGAVEHSFVDENYIFCSPWSKRFEESTYVIEAQNVPIEEVRKRWELGKIVPPGVWDGSLTPLRGPSSTGGVDQYGAFTTTDGAATQITKAGAMNDKPKDLVTVLECWIRQDDGTLKYIVCANGVILQDDASPYEDEKFPYVTYNCIPSKDHPYGHSLIAFIEKLQYAVNETLSYALDQQKYESDNPMVVNSANVDEAKNITNAPGQILVDATPDGRGYYLLAKQGMNPGWMQLQESIISKAKSIAGSVDILHGERPPGVTTLGAMEIIRDEANVLVAKMLKQIQGSRKNEAILTINRLRQFLKDKRTVRITGVGNVEDYTTVNTQAGYDLSGEAIITNAIPDDFEADVDFTPEPPGGMQAKLERDLALLQAGVVDPEFVLRDLEFDEATVQNILERQQQAQMQQMQAEAAAKNPQAAQAQQDPESMRQQVMSMLSGV